MKKKKYTIIIITAILLSLKIPAIQSYAAVLPITGKEHPIEIVPHYDLTEEINASFSIDNNTAKLSMIVNAPSSKKVNITIVLQRKDSDSWTKVQKWSKTGTGTQVLKKNMTIVKGNKYRMKYTVTVGSETVTGKTAAKTAWLINYSKAH